MSLENFPLIGNLHFPLCLNSVYTEGGGSGSRVQESPGGEERRGEGRGGGVVVVVSVGVV